MRRCSPRDELNSQDEFSAEPKSHKDYRRCRTTLLSLYRQYSSMADAMEIREGHDRAAKRLFAHANVVADLLVGFLPQGMLPEFDRRSLRRFPEERVGSRLALRRTDLAWELRLLDDRRVVLLIEAQSGPDRAMASRMTVQYGMLCEAFQRRGSVPGILPVVVHTGGRRWNAADDIARDSDSPSGLLPFASRKCYLLLDAQVLSSSQLPKGNRMSLIVRMAGAERDEVLLEALQEAQEWLESADAELFQDLVTWTVMVLGPSRFPGLKVARDGEQERVNNPGEVLNMLMDRFPKQKEELLREGRAQGRAQGIAQATRQLREEERALLRRQAMRKFGTEIGGEVSRYLSGLDAAEDFHRISDLIIDCETGGEVLGKLSASRMGGN